MFKKRKKFPPGSSDTEQIVKLSYNCKFENGALKKNECLEKGNVLIQIYVFMFLIFN